jgi:phage gpG-like protein
MTEKGSGALKVTIVGLEENKAMLAELRALDLTEWFRDQAAGIVRERLKAVIERGVDRDKWPPLHPFTLENKTGNQMMVNSGTLLRSISSLTADSIFTVGRRHMEIGSRLVYAGIQNFGGKIRVTPKMRGYLHWRGLHLKATTNHITIPKREYLFISRPMETALYSSLNSFIARVVEKRR